MKYAFVLPFGDARVAADMAREAEVAGWDGFFVWEAVWGVDAWVALGAAAMLTDRIRLGTMLTPISRMRPWDLAGKTTTVDNLSNGRVILAVGVGALDTGFAEFGEETDLRKRAELMDEGLDILTGLWKGQPFRYEGKHYSVKEVSFTAPPPPVQQPRIPIWVVGVWPRMKSLRRVLKWDGLVHQGTPGTLREARAWIEANREATTPFDYLGEGTSRGDDAAAARAVVEPWAEAGATWYLEAMWELPREADQLDVVRRRIQQGPPAVA